MTSQIGLIKVFSSKELSFSGSEKDHPKTIGLQKSISLKYDQNPESSFVQSPQRISRQTCQSPSQFFLKLKSPKKSQPVVFTATIAQLSKLDQTNFTAKYNQDPFFRMKVQTILKQYEYSQGKIEQKALSQGSIYQILQKYLYQKNSIHLKKNPLIYIGQK